MSLQTLKNCEQHTGPLIGDEVGSLVTEVGDFEGALVGDLVGDEVVGVFVGDFVGIGVGAPVGQAPHVALQMSFAGPMPLCESVFPLQMLPIFFVDFPASQPQVL